MTAISDFFKMMTSLLEFSFHIYGYTFSIKDLMILSTVVTICSRVFWGILDGTN